MKLIEKNLLPSQCCSSTTFLECTVENVNRTTRRSIMLDNDDMISNETKSMR